jgi:transposase
MFESSVSTLNGKPISLNQAILATNQQDLQALSNEELINAYKDQQKVERGFRFLKDPLFMAATLFLKSTERLIALMMVMTLCLLVYAALAHRIRQSLRQAHQNFPNQRGQPVSNPTARWVFQFFAGIHVLVIAQMQTLILLRFLSVGTREVKSSVPTGG